MKKEERQENKDEKNMQVEVNLPSSVRVNLVQGNELRQYEIFFLVASLSLSTAVSFWTSYAVQPNSTLLFSAFAFSGLFVLSVILALHYRSKLYNGSVTKTASLDV